MQKHSGNLCGSHKDDMCHLFISPFVFYLSLIFSQS